jgi:adenylate kinase
LVKLIPSNYIIRYQNLLKIEKHKIIMAEGKVIVVTGISGSGSKDFCRNYAREREKVKVYHTGDMIYEIAKNDSNEPPFPRENLLNLHPRVLGSVRDSAFERILDSLERDRRDNDRVVIDTHAQFFWNKVFENAYNWKYLNQLNTDMFVSIIDKTTSIQKAQMKQQEGRDQSHDITSLLTWQNTEVNVTSGWASNYQKPFYVLPRMQEPLIIDNLLKNKFSIYFQMPMTEASSEQDQRITQFRDKLLNVGKKINGLPTPLIDPRHIDMETGESLSEQTKEYIRRHTVHRDLRWYIPQVTDLVAFYPEGTNISKGVSDETTRGFETGKNAFVIFPKKTTSPFMDIAKRVFHSEEEFFKFFPSYMESRMKQLERK